MNDKFEDLKRLSEMLEQGQITQEEFNRLKTSLLAEEGTSLVVAQPGPRKKGRRALMAVVAGLAALAAILFLVDRLGPQYVDAEVVEEGIKDWAEEITGYSVAVRCPSGLIPATPDYRFICDLQDGLDTLAVRVTVLNREGDVEWEILG